MYVLISQQGVHCAHLLEILSTFEAELENREWKREVVSMPKEGTRFLMNRAPWRAMG